MASEIGIRWCGDEGGGEKTGDKVENGWTETKGTETSEGLVNGVGQLGLGEVKMQGEFGNPAALAAA